MIPELFGSRRVDFRQVALENVGSVIAARSPAGRDHLEQHGSVLAYGAFFERYHVARDVDGFRLGKRTHAHVFLALPFLRQRGRIALALRNRDDVLFQRVGRVIVGTGAAHRVNGCAHVFRLQDRERLAFTGEVRRIGFVALVFRDEALTQRNGAFRVQPGRFHGGVLVRVVGYRLIRNTRHNLLCRRRVDVRRVLAAHLAHLIGSRAHRAFAFVDDIALRTVAGMVNVVRVLVGMRRTHGGRQFVAHFLMAHRGLRFLNVQRQRFESGCELHSWQE